MTVHGCDFQNLRLHHFEASSFGRTLLSIFLNRQTNAYFMLCNTYLGAGLPTAIIQPNVIFYSALSFAQKDAE